MKTDGPPESDGVRSELLVISSVDYVMKEIKVNNQSTLNISMLAADKTLGEVIVVGYGTQKKIDVTGAVSRVNLEAMGNAPNTNIGQFLQGTVPGLNVGISTFAGGTPPISIRGQVTIGGNQNVLIILDGVQYTGSLSSINPDDIASIDVLKDAVLLLYMEHRLPMALYLLVLKRADTTKNQRSLFQVLTPLKNRRLIFGH